jgi:hypothetical protein
MPLGKFIVLLSIGCDICSILYVLCIPLVLYVIISISKDLWNVKKRKTEKTYTHIS